MPILQEELKTAIFKSSKLLLKNINYSLNLKLVKIGERKKSYDHYHYYDGYNIKIEYVDCKIGIKRIAQCSDEYGK